jgi:hypothetical protein
MKKFPLAAVFAACAAAPGDSARAEVHQYAFTATVQSIGTQVVLVADGADAGRMAANAIAIGDAVTGRFSLDSNSPLLGASNPDAGYQVATYHNTGLPLLSIQFGAGQQAFTVRQDWSEIRVVDSTVPYQPDLLSVYGAETPYDRLYVDFSDRTTTVLDSTVVDPTALGDFPDRRFVYEHLAFVNDYWEMTTVQGALTSLTLVAIVPEPAPYGMFAAGLGLLAWRRHARTRREG